MDIGGVRGAGEIDPTHSKGEEAHISMNGEFGLPEKAGAPGKWDKAGNLQRLEETGIPIPAAIRSVKDGPYPLSGDFHGQDPTVVLSALIKEIGRRT